jgi:hypothetical protein
MGERDGDASIVGTASLLGLRNLRDLGGLATRSGDVVRAGRFFRSSALSRFGVAQRQALASLDLRWVIDLRGTAEVTKAGAAIVLPGARVVQVPFFETARPNWSAPTDQTPRATASRYLEMLEGGLPRLAAAILQVAEASSAPFVVCCSAGRDRTGIVVVCLLDLLDVPDDAIASDYARSDLFDQQTGRAHPETILDLLAQLRTRYGSAKDMLAPHSITEDTLKTLREGLLVRHEAE